MTKNTMSILLKGFVAIIFTMVILIGCASIQQPQGGPRDVTPPKVLKMTPENLTVNFNTKILNIEFDEYFKIENEIKEFSVSPEMPRPPVLKKKQKKLEITFPDSLDKNTTYTLNFGKAIQDVNESNPIKNLTYVFSTGSKLDSLSIKGRVTNSLTGEPVLDAIAFIFPVNKDTLLGKGKPSYYTTTDSSGLYSLNNLRKDTYRIYAIKEKSPDKIYQQGIEQIGFIQDSVGLTSNLDSMNMKIFQEDAKVFRMIDKRINPDGSISFVFNQKLKTPEITVLEPAKLDSTKKIRFSKNNDSLKVWLTDLSFDSTKISIKNEGKIVQTTTLTRGKKETYTRSMSSVDNIEGSLLNPNKPLKLTFSFPLENVDVSKITLLEDSVDKKNFTVTKDSLDFLSCYVRYPWKPKKNYDLNFAAGAFTAIFNTKNKEFNRSFQLISKDEYGTLKVSIVTPEKDKSYILEVVDGNRNVVTTLNIKKDTTAIFANYKAGKYFIRITYDTNKNGVWDTGDVSAKKQPEKIWIEPKELSIRPLWERNEIINIPKE